MHLQFGSDIRTVFEQYIYICVYKYISTHTFLPYVLQTCRRWLHILSFAVVDKYIYICGCRYIFTQIFPHMYYRLVVVGGIFLHLPFDCDRRVVVDCFFIWNNFSKVSSIVIVYRLNRVAGWLLRIFQLYSHCIESKLSSGWLRLVGSLKWYLSFSEYSLFYRALLQKRPVIIRSLLIEATL